MKNNLALYMHIPFCQRKCAYCDFISFSASPETRRLYLESLLKEMDLYGDLLQERSISSLYLGGGTPSLLDEGELRLLLEGIFKRVSPQGELDFEANPESITREKIRILQEYGDFRISLGAQSFDEKVLELFGRGHHLDQLYKSYAMLREEGVKRISLDLIYALGKEYAMEANVKAIQKLQPEHLSLYALELHPHRPLSHHLSEADEEIYLRDFGYLKEEVEKIGYQRYEVSSFSKAGEESQHNLVYWKGGDYLGLGLAAHGFLRPRRYSNEKNLKHYGEMIEKGQLPLAYQEELSPQDLRFEAFMLGLRLVEGIDLEERGLLPLSKTEEEAIQKHMDHGLLLRDGNHLRFSEQGFDLSNHVLVDFLEK